jgi:hypothetical protein
MSTLNAPISRWLPLALTLAACHDGNYLSYEWDDRRILCSFSVDDLSQPAPRLLLDDEIRYAADARRVTLMHAHKPGVTVTRDMIDRVLTRADEAGLDYFTYADLVPGPHRPGIALAFDDNSVEEWLGIRDLLDAHHARVTFFVTRYAELSDAEHAGLLQLAADGHDLEPHSVHHIHATAYVAEYGLDAYIQDEVLPSFEVLEAIGSQPTTYAYPFGVHSSEIDDAVLQYVAKVRVTPGSCPW